MSDHRDTSWATEGQRACIIGFGTAVIVHVHTVIARTTKTQIVSTDRHGTEYRHHREDGVSVGSRGHHSYGGSTIHSTCQRPKPKTR